MNIEVRDENLLAATPTTVGGYGLQFVMMEAAANVDIKFLNESRVVIGEAKNVPPGLSIKFDQPITAAVLTSATPQAVKVAFATRDAVFNRISGNVSATIQQAATVLNDSAVMTTSAAEILTADTSRLRLILTAHPDNTGTIYIGGEASVLAGNAARRLEAGEAFIDESAAAAAVWAFSSTAGDVLCYEVAQ